MSLEVLKDLLGLIGSILAIIPFLRDFASRMESERWWRWNRSIPVFREQTHATAVEKDKKLRAPSTADLQFVAAGILLLIASFGLSLYIGLTKPEPECTPCAQTQSHR